MSLILYRNGSVYSPADPLATAMLVDGNTIAWVGGEEAAASLHNTQMHVVDLAGALITPGFVDSHVHLTETGMALDSLDLSQTRSLGDVVAALEGSAQQELITGFGWDETQWRDGQLSTSSQGTFDSAAEIDVELSRKLLDRILGEQEVYLARVDVHSAVVSTALAERLGLRELDGWHDNGLVVREAHTTVRNAIRRPNQLQRARYQEQGLKAAAAAGIVAVAEMVLTASDDALDDASMLMARQQQDKSFTEVIPYWGQAVTSAAEGKELLARLEESGVVPVGLGGDLNIDGSLGSRTARLRQDYTDAPGERGTQYLSVAEITQHLVACTELGIQAGFHVIGDGGVAALVEALSKAAEQVGAPAIRAAQHRVEHVEMTDDDALSALAEYSVVASIQPSFDAWWGGTGALYQQRLGEQRARGMNRVASLMRQGVPVALGSDTPVTPFDPWGSVQACVEHHQAAERISARGAFLAHTRGGWRAAKSSQALLGQLVPGAPASYAIWQVEELMVKVPDERIQSWSTDPRARTPVLPALDTENRPKCLLTVHHGIELFRSNTPWLD